MTVAVGVLLRDPRVGYALGVVAVLFLAVAVGSFGVSVEETTPDPVSFDDTLTAGLAGEERFTLAEEDLVVPRAQVFYSQYRYVVGYHGIGHALAEFDQPGHAQQFGYPIAVYVWDFADTGVALSEDGSLYTDEKPEWTDAETAQFVVDSEARTPAGETAVPFGSAAAARSFADRFGGRVVDWTALQDHSFDVDDAAVVRSRVDDQRQSADERVSAARPLADREVSVTVGEGAPTIQAAIDAAPPETAVRIPPGTYDETLVVDKPVTLRGESATIRGTGTGSVVRVTGDDAAVVGVSVSGVGNRTTVISAHLGAEAFERLGELTLVVDSDVEGAMGGSLIGFSDPGDAESFADEHGGDLLEHGEVTPEIVSTLSG